MNIPFEISFLPEADSPLAIQNHAERFAQSDMPAFVIRQAGETLPEAIELIRPLLPGSVSFLHERHNQSFPNITHDGNGNPIYDKGTACYKGDYAGLHVDVSSPDEPHTDLNFHHTAEGKIRASFFMPGPALLARLVDNNRAPMPSRVMPNFRDGLIDPDIMEPVCHRADLNPGDMVVFREGWPVVHGFDTLQAPRHSVVRFGILATPSLIYNLRNPSGMNGPQ